jgi:endoglucanase
MRFTSFLALFAAPLVYADCYTAPPTAGKLQLKGVNLSGFDWGIDTNGNANLAGATPPTQGQGDYNGYGQLWHFYNNVGFNVFRLPVSWQYLINSNTASATLDNGHFGNYNGLVSSCLQLGPGVKCIVDIHNYARFQGNIIGQGGPSNAMFAQLWANIASKFSNQPNAIFDLMNEPHDIDMGAWVNTVQAVVNSIRNTVGNNNHIILLPGTGWMSAAAFNNGGDSTQLLNVKNPDGSTDNLIFNVHGYFDYDYSGTHTDCSNDQIGGWGPFACWLRQNGRKAMLTEVRNLLSSSYKSYI